MKNMAMGEAEYQGLARSMRKVEFFAPFTVAELEDILALIELYAYFHSRPFLASSFAFRCERHAIQFRSW